MAAKSFAAAACFDSDQLNFLIADEVVKDSNCIRSAADTRNNRRRQFAFSLHYLRTRFLPDHTMEVAHHRRIGMRTEHTAEKVMRGPNVRDPVAHGFVDGVFQRARARVDTTNFGTEKPHAKNIQFLPPHVFSAHIDHTLKSKERANSCGCN